MEDHWRDGRCAHRALDLPCTGVTTSCARSSDCGGACSTPRPRKPSGSRRHISMWMYVLVRVCIDQANIGDDVQILPVNVMSCIQLLVLWGLTPSYRLWWSSIVIRTACFAEIIQAEVAILLPLTVLGVRVCLVCSFGMCLCSLVCNINRSHGRYFCERFEQHVFLFFVVHISSMYCIASPETLI